MTQPPLDDSALARLQRIGGADLARQMIELFLGLGPERIQALLDGVAAGDASRVERAAHSLKSAAGNVGAVVLQHAAQEVETLAGAGSIDAALAQQLEIRYHESIAALRRTLQELGQ